MKRLLSVFLLLMCTVSLKTTVNAQSTPKVVAFYPEWMMRPYNSAQWCIPPDSVDWTGIDIVVLFSGTENVDYTTSPYWTYVTNPNDSIDIEFQGISSPRSGPSSWRNELQILVNAVHAKGGKVVIDVHQVNNTSFSHILPDSAMTQTMVNSIVSWCERKNLDGVEVDMEYWATGWTPTSAQMGRLTRIFRRRLDQMPNGRGILIYAPSYYDANMYSSAFDDLVDGYYLQSYYQDVWNGTVGSNSVWWSSPLYRGTDCPGSDAQAIASLGPLQWVAAGHSASKMGIIVPSYNYTYKGQNQLCVSDGGVPPGYGTYQQALSLLNNGGTKSWDDVVKEPVIKGTAISSQGNPGGWAQWGVSAGMKFFCTYEDSMSLSAKVSWVKANNIGGVSLFSMDMEADPSQRIRVDRFPLTKYLVRAVGAVSAPPDTTRPVISNVSSTNITSSTATITWTTNETANSQVEYGTTTAYGSSTTLDASYVTSHSQSLSNLSASTTYHYRVKSTDPSGNLATSANFTFTTTAPPAPPSTPTPSSPSNGAVGVSTNPTLSWNASAGATSYQLQVSTSSSFTTTVVNQSGITATSYAVSGLSYSTTYYWRVNATNAGGTSSYSITWNFTTAAPPPSPSAPTLSSPSNGATGVSLSPTLSWNASSGATSYQLQVSTSSGFTTTVVNQSGITTTSYTASGLSGSTTYYWRVNATNGGGTSAYSTAWSFTTAAAPSGLVAAYSFNEGSGNAVTDYSGNGFTGTISGATWTTSGKFGNGLVFNGTNAKVTVSNATLLQLTTGMTLEAWVYPTTVGGGWRDVIMKGADDYYLVTNPSGAPATGSDALGSTLSGPSALTANTWTHLAATYDGTTLRLYMNGTQVVSRSQTGSMQTSTNPLQVGGDNAFGQYFAGRIDEVRIYNRALTQAEIQSDMNTLIGGTTSPPSAPTLSSPSNTATGVSTTPTLSWNASSGATSYQLQVSTSSSFSTTVVNQSGITSTSYTPSVLTGNTTYYWRVSATNAGGTSAYSTAWSFTTALSHSIVLSSGPNLISSVVLPRNSTLDTLLAKIIPRMGQYDVMKNSQGQVFWPALSVNQIGTWNHLEGYQISVSTADTLTVTGTEIAPEATPIPLPLQGAGVNIVPYLRHSPMRADSALAGILNILVIAKNNAGQVYWPSQGINQIGLMKPGQGYQVQVTQASTLVYPANATAGPPVILGKQQEIVIETDTPSPLHYQPRVTRTGANAVLLVEAPDLKESDEIAVWTTSKILVGSGAMRRGKALITVWGDNIATHDIIDGAVEGESLTLTFWSAAEQNEGSLTVLSLTDALTSTASTNSLRYKSNAVWVARVTQASEIPKVFTLSQNFPNPFNPSTLIRYGLPFNAMVTLEVFNILGQRVALVVNEEQKAGNHEVIFQNSTLGSGVYFYRLVAGEFTATKKMVLIR
jgi:GH18 family chitinase